MSTPDRKSRLAFNLLQLYSLEAWGSDEAPEELPLEEVLDAFIAAVVAWDRAGDNELGDYVWMAQR